MNLKFWLIGSLSSSAIPISLMNIQSSWNNEVIFATYQSYISDEIAEEAHNKFNLKTTYFENDKEILRGFQLGSYDLATVSSSTLEEAISKKIVKKIDWSRLKGIPEKYKNKEEAEKKDKPFLDSLFAPVVNKIFEGNPQLANYGIPYFLSYLSFVYRGEKLKDKEKEPKSWSELFKTLSEDSRFKKDSTKLPRLGLIEDELTIYSLSKLGTDNYFKDASGETRKSQKHFYDRYQELSKKGLNSGLGVNSIVLNSDSALLSEMLISEQLKGAFMYNGEILYAYKTLKEESKEKKVEDFHIFEGAPELWLLDSIAISANISPTREEKVYDFLNELLFEGVLEENKGATQTTQENQKTSVESSWAWKNFDFLQYTPVLQALHDKLQKENQEKSKEGEEQKSDEMTQKLLFGASLKKDDQSKWCNKKPSDTQQSKDCTIVFEKGFSDLENLNLALAFQQWKNEL